MAGEEGTTENGKYYVEQKEKMDMKTLVEAEDRRNNSEDVSIYWIIRMRRQTNTKWERNELLQRMAKK